MTYFRNDVLISFTSAVVVAGSYDSKIEPPGTYFVVCSVFPFPHSLSWETERSSFIEVFISALAVLISKGSFMSSFLSRRGSVTCL